MLVTLKKYRKSEVERLPVVAHVLESTLDSSTGKTPRRFHRLTHDRNKIWYYTIRYRTILIRSNYWGIVVPVRKTG